MTDPVRFHIDAIPRDFAPTTETVILFDDVAELHIDVRDPGELWKVWFKDDTDYPYPTERMSYDHSNQTWTWCFYDYNVQVPCETFGICAQTAWMTYMYLSIQYRKGREGVKAKD